MQKNVKSVDIHKKRERRKKMKKITTSLLLTLLLISIPFGLVGCKRNKSKTTIYKFSECIIDVELESDSDMTAEEAKDWFGKPTKYASIELNSDGTAKFIVEVANNESDEVKTEEHNATWGKLGNNKIVFAIKVVETTETGNENGEPEIIESKEYEHLLDATLEENKLIFKEEYPFEKFTIIITHILELQK